MNDNAMQSLVPQLTMPFSGMQGGCGSCGNPSGLWPCVREWCEGGRDDLGRKLKWDSQSQCDDMIGTPSFFTVN